MESEDYVRSATIGTLVYMPPEPFQSGGITSPAWDIWSLGISIIQALTQNIPYHFQNNIELIGQVSNGNVIIPNDLAAPFDQIVKGFLIKDRKQRWTSQRVIEALNPQSINIAPNIITPKSPNISTPPQVASQFRREIYAPANPKNLVLNLPNNQTIELVEIPSGSFMMGSGESQDEKPIHKVTLRGFRMGKYPITQKQYKAVMGNNPSCFQEDENCPVEQVSWNNAIAFCQKLSGMIGQTIKLPSEAQWEYACRAGSSREYYFGNNKNQLGRYAWYNKNSGDTTHAVGMKLANPWGLYDMHGNVCEWCEDVWHESYYGAPTDGSAWLNGND